ncbi:hypothetical protein ABZ901_29305, partial [Actinacidiphila alni]
ELPYPLGRLVDEALAALRRRPMRERIAAELPGTADELPGTAAELPGTAAELSPGQGSGRTGDGPADGTRLADSPPGGHRGTGEPG